ncbi:MAG: response regulator [Bdellovibrionales bacterium]|nr:response regulator [Bdellovibrionales bacterium]
MESQPSDFSTTTHLATGSDEASILRQKVLLLFRQASLSLIATLVVAALIVWTYWHSAPRSLLITWFACMATVLYCRALLSRRFAKIHLSISDSTAWANRYIFGAFCTAVCWGLLSVLLFPWSTPIQQMFIVVSLGGMIAGSVPVLSVFRHATFLYVIPVMTPLTIQLLVSDLRMFQALGAMALCFVTVMVGSARRTQRTIEAMLRLRLQKNELVKYLSKSNREMHLLNEELLQARDAAEESSRTKSQFLANMSHELRTPLNGIVALVELLRSSDLHDQQKQDVKKLISCVDTLKELVNDVLDFSKISSGLFTVTTARFSVAELTESLADVFETQGQQKDCSIQFKVSPDVPDEVIGDSSCIHHILSNLLSNAIKFSYPGSQILFSLTFETTEKTTPYFHFTVKDSGIGIATDDHEKIFNAFAQADPSLSKKSGGTGLGLAIAHNLVKLMDGKIWVESSLGKGSTFHVTVPIELTSGSIETPQEKLPAQSSSSLVEHTLSILLAEDNPLGQEVVVRVLEKQGYQVLAVSCGQSVLDTLNAKPAAYFDCILMDLQMPGMDGISAAKVIRQSVEHFAAIPIIALTGNAVESVQQECLACGMNAFATKPIDFKQLFVLINSTVESSRKQGKDAKQKLANY